MFAAIGPGLLLAATGVGGGDLATGSFAGSILGTAVLWAVLVGAFLKFVVTEGLARWQLATGDSFLEVDGRIEDYVLTPDGRLVGRMDHAFKEQLDVAEAQILQKDQDSIDLMIVPRATYNEASHRSVLKEIRSRLGDEIQVRIHLVSSIPREPNGKFRAVKSRVGRNAP